MDEYIKREDAIKAITWNGLSEPEEIVRLILLTAQNNIRRISAADVVPKSEVFLASSDAMKMLIECHGYALTHDADIKKEVAREIFDEIKKIFVHRLLHSRDAIDDISGDLDELKKKYDKDCRDCRYFVGCETACGGRPCDEFEAKKEV